MSDRLPPPDFNSLQYERPNQKWVCGKASCGQACRLGPDAHGHCHVTTECQPGFVVKPGDTKGRYRCTRPKEFGGECTGGPLPDGSCCRPLTKCVPVRSLRSKRKVFTLAVVILTAGFLLISLSDSEKWNFISPGPLSKQHSTFTFAHRAKQDDEGNCAVCHRAASSGITGWVGAAMAAKPGPVQIKALAVMEPHGMTAIDRNCLQCHVGHSFHEPNVADERSCSLCHVEHEGPGRMHAPADATCQSCHANPEVMQTSITRASKLPASAFDYRPAMGRAIFNEPRPPNGYTQIIHTFDTDHPEFQFKEQNLKDPDTLNFNHEIHLGSVNVSSIKGRKLTCVDCHKPDASGVHFLKITFEQNCQECHSLQFDVRNPEIRVPHGDAEHVRAFLRSLSQEYADYAATKGGIGNQAAINTYVNDQIEQLRKDYGSGEELERRVFFSTQRWSPISAPGGGKVLGSAVFPGCAYCHEVKPSPTGAPLVTDPVIPDRWMIHGNFDHAKHLVSATGVNGKVVCSECHDVEHSRLTSDVLLPGRQICLECHSPKGGVSDSCSTCHSYHSPRKEPVALR